jgi:tight adherence protein C
MMVILIAIAVACLGFGFVLALSGAGVIGSNPHQAVEERISHVVEVTRDKSRDFQVVDLTDGLNTRVGSPLLRWAGNLGRRLTPPDRAKALKAKLDMAGNPPGWTVEKVFIGKGAGIVFGAAAGILLAAMLGPLPGVILLPACALAGFSIPNMVIHQKAYDRKKQIERDLPDMLDLLTISVEAGLGFEAAIRQVAQNTKGPISEELSRAIHETHMGAELTTALADFGKRTGVEDIQRFTAALIQAKAQGISIGETLRVQSDEMRTRKSQRVEETAQKVPVKILFPLIFCIMPALFVVILGPAVISIVVNLGR